MQFTGFTASVTGLVAHKCVEFAFQRPSGAMTRYTMTLAEANDFFEAFRRAKLIAKYGAKAADEPATADVPQDEGFA